jgi:hypothetical protein
VECKNGYVPGPPCSTCTEENRCLQCERCTNCRQSWCHRPQHNVNYCVAQTVCMACEDEPLKKNGRCVKCGSRCEECSLSEDDERWFPPCPGTCGLRQVIFSGPDTLDEFGRWLFCMNHRYCTAVAHYMKGYDGVFLLSYLLDNAMKPDKIIYNGSKIMYMSLESKLHIRVVDSLSFLPMPLKALPNAFGLEGVQRGYFAHFFNTSENQTHVGPTYPPLSAYGADNMSTKEREAFLEWYEKHRHETFDFRKQIRKYILRLACRSFVPSCWTSRKIRWTPSPKSPSPVAA